MIASAQRWRRAGLVLAERDDGCGSAVLGDPCVVWDDEAHAWRMFLFALPPGHGQALCTGDPCDPRAWEFHGPLAFENPDALIGGAAFKPFVVLEAGASRAARIRGRHALLLVVDHRAKIVQRAWSDRLAGPWTIERAPLITRGTGGDFDTRHVDAVSGYYFPADDEVLYFYMGYPERAQRHALSPFGSAQGLAVEQVAAGELRKHGVVLRPSERRGHWASGWVGGLQLVRGREHRWVGVVNASPTPPDREDPSLWAEEPPPSLGGMAFCDAERPTDGWRWCDEPFEWIDDLPATARAAGEGTNLWRHHALLLDDGRAALFYNSGKYFEEKLFLKVAEAPSL
jgi:hypothetical protein